jgi:hypothetical protein
VIRADSKDLDHGGARELLDALATLAVDAGAAHVAADVRRIRVQAPDGMVTPRQRQLCRCLAHHLWELQRALNSTTEEANGTINAFSILRVLAEALIHERESQPDRDRDNLDEWLKAERTRFLMATKVDAALALDDRIVRINRSGSELRHTTAIAVGEIVSEALLRFRERLRGETETKLALVRVRFLADVERTFGAVGETIPFDAVAGLPMMLRSFASELDANTSIRASISDRIKLSTRQRIERAARDQVLDGLERGSRRLILRILHDYDDARTTLEHHFCCVLDSCLESAKYAAQFAADARAGNSDGVARARARIDRWYTTLSTITTRLV